MTVYDQKKNYKKSPGITVVKPHVVQKYRRELMPLVTFFSLFQP